jgi:hypothetical protein
VLLEAPLRHRRRESLRLLRPDGRHFRRRRPRPERRTPPHHLVLPRTESALGAARKSGRPVTAGLFRIVKRTTSPQGCAPHEANLCVSLERRPRRVGNVTLMPYGDFLDTLWGGELTG